ncbi:MAG: hypothetical protein KF685_12230 [Acidobacteria bacterium]|nr:hypothetical protein [Acidobacteriota bacterium]
MLFRIAGIAGLGTTMAGLVVSPFGEVAALFASIIGFLGGIVAAFSYAKDKEHAQMLVQ